jgi:ABC-type nickel/cobalt efflux system permease component RcnA
MKICSPLIRCLLLLSFAGSVSAISAQEAAAWKVRVSISDQKVYVYKNENLERTLICSTGVPGTDDATPVGDYILNESGSKRGTWFYSDTYKEGARYWVGFVGGTYLFHSVPMDRSGTIIESEAKKLGKPASHGCIRLSLEDARWFYESVPNGARVRIFAESALSSAGCDTKSDVTAWLSANMQNYRQKYTLSCEIALIRLSLAVAGIRDLSEDEILGAIPKGTDPETTFVCEDISAGRKNKDGSIRWNNYGTHAPVVAKTINKYLEERGLAGQWNARVLKADDGQLHDLMKDPSFRGAIIWLVGHPERWGDNPPVNERGMVLGEHVRFLEPSLSSDGNFRIRDPETGKLLESSSAGASRNLFSYRVVGLFESEANIANAQGDRSTTHGDNRTSGKDNSGGKIHVGAPDAKSRSGAMISIGNTIRKFIEPESGARELLLLALLALGYGVLHALGPGHQKTLVSGYLLSEGGGIRAAVAAGGLASASHAVSVLGLFAVLAVVGSGFGVIDITNASNLVTTIAGILLVALALLMVYRRTTSLIKIIRKKETDRAECDCALHHHHHHGDENSRDEERTRKRGAIPLLISGSLSPCPGAAFFLLYGFHEGNPLAGIIAVIAISFGMWVTLISVGLITVSVRKASLMGANKGKSTISTYLPSLLGVCGSCVVLAFAVLMVIPG